MRWRCRKLGLQAATKARVQPSQQFNGQNDPVVERDFEWLAELGFNFVRLPMDYHMWIEGGDWTKFRESTLKQIDEAVDLGTRHGVRVFSNDNYYESMRHRLDF
jgi:aryl-phospho-beta-D-glucosidase BglC (GH1 family)